MNQADDEQSSVTYSMHTAGRAFQALHENKSYKVEAPGGALISLCSGVCVPDSLTFDFIAYCHRFIAKHPELKTIADLGTGSGVIAVSLAKLHFKRQFAAFDISQKALELANRNAVSNSLDNLFLLASQPGRWIPSEYQERIDLIVSNPPFIGTDEWNSTDLMTDFPDCRYQPQLAMRAHDRYGLSEYLAIIREAIDQGVQWVIFRANGDYIDKLEAALRPLVKSVALRQGPDKCPVLVVRLGSG